MLKPRFAFFVLIGLFLSGCVSTNLTRSGFLDDYSFFEESTVYPGMMVNFPDKKPAAISKLKSYDKFMVDEISLYIPPKRLEALALKQETIDKLTDYFKEQIIKVLENKYSLVEKADSNVLRIRIAVTDMMPAKPCLNLHWATKITKAGLGGASVEAEFCDSLSGERIFAVLDSRLGRSLQLHKGLTKWGYTKDTFFQWAQIIGESLKELTK